MKTAYLTADEYIAAQAEKIEQLTTDRCELRKAVAALTAINLKLSTTDLSPAEIAQTLIAGCPGWVEVTAHLLYARIMLEAPRGEHDDFMIAN